MKHGVKVLWLAALRSGEFKQGYRRLRTVDVDATFYCVMGVLCELHREVTGAGDWQEDGRYQPLEGKGSNFCIPPAVCDWAGLDLPQECISKTGERCGLNPKVNRYHLASYNDGDAQLVSPHNFHELAEIIEEADL